MVNNINKMNCIHTIRIMNNQPIATTNNTNYNYSKNYNKNKVMISTNNRNSWEDNKICNISKLFIQI